jgi:hypothetical protein
MYRSLADHVSENIIHGIVNVQKVKSATNGKGDNELQEVTTSGNMRNMSKYCISAECTENNLAITNTEIRIRVFGKDFINNIVETSLIQIITDSA